MFTSTVIRWGEDRAWVRHPAVGDILFWKKDTAPSVQARWASLRGMSLAFDLSSGRAVNVRFP